jgi:hypothetical protein
MFTKGSTAIECAGGANAGAPLPTFVGAALAPLVVDDAEGWVTAIVTGFDSHNLSATK